MELKRADGPHSQFVSRAGCLEVADRPDFPFLWEALRAAGMLSCWEGEASAAARVATKDRSGIVPGEGAGIVVLERLSNVLRQGRAQAILAEVTGVSVAAPPHQGTPFQPDISGAAGGAAAGTALQRACFPPRQTAARPLVFFPHITGTRGDIAEARAAEVAFRDFPGKVLATTGLTHNGHGFAATGAWNTILAALMLKLKQAPITLHLDSESQDKAIKLDFITTPGPIDAQAAVVHAYGFYNLHSALVLEPVALEQP